MRENPELPLHTLAGGFSPAPEEGKSSKEGEPKPEELEKNKTESPINSNNIKAKKKYSKPVRRGGDCKRKYMDGKCASSLKIFSANCAGLRNGKLRSLNAEVKSTNANIITLQETHYKQKGKVKLDKHFVVFEAIRSKKGGGTAIAIHEDLKPKLIHEYNDEFELLVVEIMTEKESVRIVSGYGPQENLEEEKRRPFFLALETEIEKSELAGVSVIIELDANSKLGKQYIPNDPHGMSPNGVLLSDIIERHNLIVCNGSSKCSGTITRKRVTKQRTEESVIDVVLISSELKEHMVSVHIDEEKKHVLTKIHKTKRGTRVKESDHNTIISQFNLKVATNNKREKIEVYNLRNKECQSKFKAFTTETKMFSTIFDGSDDIDILTERLVKKINGSIATNFTKRRISFKSEESKDEDLFAQRRKLKGKTDEKSRARMKEVTDSLAQKAEDNFNKLKEELSKIKTKGAIDAKQMWKLRKRMCPKNRDPPTAIIDKHGNLLTSDEAINNRALEVFTERLDNNPIKSHLKDLEKDTNDLCEINLNLAKNNKTEPWTMTDLDDALKDLENGKSRDANGFANEIFKIAGEDLRIAVLKLMNMMKERQMKYLK